MLRSGVGRTLLVLLLASGVVGAGGAPALAVPVSGHVTAASDAGLPFSTPSTRYSSDRGTIDLAGSRRFVNINAVDRDSGRFHVHLTAPEGRDLTAGVYDKAVKFADQGSGSPGISIADGCGETTGRFEVLDIAFDARGEPSRLWAVYESRCPYPPATSFGEIRLGYPEAPALSTAPSLVRWPVVDPRGAGAVVPVAVGVTEPLTISSVAVTGPDASTMPVRLDECTGRTILPGIGCEVFVRFKPTTAGTRTAALRVRAEGGRTVDVRLQGYARGGRTQLRVEGAPGEYVTDGRAFTFTPANAFFSIQGVRQLVRFQVTGHGAWNGSFGAGPGDILAPGRYVDPGDRYPEVTPGVEIAAPGRGCHGSVGSFTVTEATYEPDGNVRSFGADFEQRCEPHLPALRGTFEYRIGDTAPPAPWTLRTGVFGPPTPEVPASGPDGPPWPVDDQPASTPRPPVVPTVPVPAVPPPPPVGSTPPATTPKVPPTAAVPSAPAPPAAPAPSSPPARTAAPPAAPPAALKEPGPCTTGSWRRLTRRGDRFTGTSGPDWIRGGGGADLLRMGAGADCAEGGAGNDRLEGGPGADLLAGGTGADVLLGGSGDDTLDGGPGRDRVDCGAGRGDTARVGPGDTVRGCERVLRVRTR